ncbi:protein of unknown function [endosymbiont DhMRE of Dentiscutata heterogama]|uniref:hypothetical protein n=1 Tax=endosymbiont DhMRE of Dentiscutata heterogama TaxID=1609546 RepID=UPI000629D486|nr:hypothetical protein [endosymbiont DhMRE of Dentiscutata heterogama]CFW93289.1 protein of unknown function [endosymbiont DhMRE of Dentiscutata heterogama]
MDYWTNRDQIITKFATIQEVIQGTGKDGGKFLILKTNPDKIFVFDKHVPKKEWGELREGSSYELELKEGKNGNKKLMGFTEVVRITIKGDGKFDIRK